MTKAKMIETMQKREAKANKQVMYYAKKYGYINQRTKLYLWKWGEIYQLMDELGIETKREEA